MRGAPEAVDALSVLGRGSAALSFRSDVEMDAPHATATFTTPPSRRKNYCPEQREPRLLHKSVDKENHYHRQSRWYEEGP